jgi:hypothetical protein
MCVEKVVVKEKPFATPLLDQSHYVVGVGNDHLIIKAAIVVRVPVDPVPVPICGVHPQAWKVSKQGEILFLQGRAITKD